ncbi:SpaH/EbpB family LPXTG-anchored major pilin [Lactococcus formosensis subsp. formosensis]|uniref:SpaH/EbpB family LPXTG-anchored major pilin n=1 Tax=Lactococcus formosensis TaxID=1281486 RepID=UPI0013FD25B9
MKKNTNMLVQLFITFLAVLSIIAIPTIKSVFAEDMTNFDKEEKVSVTINKRIWTDETPDEVQNTGEEMPDFGGEPLNGAEFTVYDVTDKYYELSEEEGSDQKKIVEAIQADAAQSAPSYATKIDSKVTTGQGQATFTNLDIKNASNRYHVYLFLETKTPNNVTVTKKSTPIVLAMPIYKVDAKQEFTDELNTNIQLYPKNETATDTKEFTNVDSFEEVTVGDQTFANVTIGDILSYKLTINIPANIGDSNAVTSFKIHDKPSVGLALKDETVEVGDLQKDDDYMIDFADGSFTIALNLESDKVKALAGQKLELNYDMQLTAEVNPDELQNNKASVQINDEPEQEITPPMPVGTGGYKFVKKDSRTGKELSGAEFVVANADQTKFAKFAAQKNLKGEYVFESWVDSKAAASRVISDDKGSLKVIGLVNGEYILNEVKAPSSDYVLLKDGTITFTVEHGQYGTSELEVMNTPKGLLPSTGGVGTYTFLIVGVIMMATAALLVKKNKKQL